MTSFDDYINMNVHGFHGYNDEADEFPATQEQIAFHQKKFADPEDKALIKDLVDAGLDVFTWSIQEKTKQEIKEQANEHIHHVWRRVAIKFASDPVKRREMLVFSAKILYLGHRVVYRKRSRPGVWQPCKEPPARTYLHEEDYYEDFVRLNGGRLS